MAEQGVKFCKGILLVKSKSGVTKLEKVIVEAKPGKNTNHIKCRFRKYLKPSKIPVLIKRSRRKEEKEKSRDLSEISPNIGGNELRVQTVYFFQQENDDPLKKVSSEGVNKQSNNTEEENEEQDNNEVEKKEEEFLHSFRAPLKSGLRKLKDNEEQDGNEGEDERKESLEEANKQSDNTEEEIEEQDKNDEESLEKAEQNINTEENNEDKDTNKDEKQESFEEASTKQDDNSEEDNYEDEKKSSDHDEESLYEIREYLRSGLRRLQPKKSRLILEKVKQPVEPINDENDNAPTPLLAEISSGDIPVTPRRMKRKSSSVMSDLLGRGDFYSEISEASKSDESLKTAKSEEELYKNDSLEKLRDLEGITHIIETDDFVFTDDDEIIALANYDASIELPKSDFCVHNSDISSEEFSDQEFDICVHVSDKDSKYSDENLSRQALCVQLPDEFSDEDKSKGEGLCVHLQDNLSDELSDEEKSKGDFCLHNKSDYVLNEFSEEKLTNDNV